MAAIRDASPQALHHFTQADQVNQLVSASEAEPDLGFGRGDERLAPTLHPIGSKDPDALKIPGRRAASTLTWSVRSPVPAEPAHKDDLCCFC